MDSDEDYMEDSEQRLLEERIQ